MKNSFFKAAFAMILALVLPHLPAAARSIEYTVNAGFNLGGTTPMGLPASIRKIDSYNPTLNLAIGVNASKMLSPKWGVGAGVLFETKGMHTSVTVKNYHLTMYILRGDATGTRTGYYTGGIRNETKIGYITIPLYAAFRPGRNWEIDFGPYFAVAINRSFKGKVYGGSMRETPLEPAIGVDQAEYDYSDDINRFDMGLSVAGSRRIYKGLGIRAALNWGVLSTLKASTRKIDMDTYNVYLNIGLNYTF